MLANFIMGIFKEKVFLSIPNKRNGLMGSIVMEFLKEYWKLHFIVNLDVIKS
jgi:hypothetical protein